MKKPLSIGQTANLLGVSIATLRNWDKEKKLVAIRSKSEKGYRYYHLEQVEEFSKNLGAFKLAKKWIGDRIGFEPLSRYYCPDKYIFQSRFLKSQKQLDQLLKNKNLSFSIGTTAGEIGDNAFDHNFGNWPNIPGIFLNYDFKKREIVLADRGQGVLKTLKRVKKSLKNHSQALETAFTEYISGRSPEKRGKGLKEVREVVTNSQIKLFFQTGNAQISLSSENPEIKIEKSKNVINGCLIKIKY